VKEITVFKRIALAAVAVAATVGPIVLSAQIVAPTPETPIFEAASIRPAADTGRTGGRGTPGRFAGFNLSLRRLIRQAYDIHDAQIVGGPDWADSQGFDINATTGEKPPDQMRFMMQTLLRDRFKLAFHTEKRELPIYALVVARSDGKLGSGLKRIPDGECPPPGARRSAPPAGGPPAGPPPSPFDPNAQAPCGSLVFGPGRLLAHGVGIEQLARSIGALPAITSFNRIVVNETKLEGQYDFDFKWTNEFAARGGPPPAGPLPTPAPGDEPTLVTALQEQLGLKLDARRATVDVLVIDSAEKPSEN
jgi:bla regulator protein blaR1